MPGVQEPQQARICGLLIYGLVPLVSPPSSYKHVRANMESVPGEQLVFV